MTIDELRNLARQCIRNKNAVGALLRAAQDVEFGDFDDAPTEIRQGVYAAAEAAKKSVYNVARTAGHEASDFRRAADAIYARAFIAAAKEAGFDAEEPVTDLFN